MDPPACPPVPLLHGPGVLPHRLTGILPVLFFCAVQPVFFPAQQRVLVILLNRHTNTSVADPDPGSGAFLTPGSGMDKKSGSGSGMNNPDHIFESLETIFWVKLLKFFDADCVTGYGKEKFWIRDKNPESAMLASTVQDSLFCFKDPTRGFGEFPCTQILNNAIFG
jgi:hypothetical protein